MGLFCFVFYYMNFNGLSHWKSVALSINHIRKLPAEVMTSDLPFLAAIEVKYYLRNPPQSSSDIYEVP